MSILTRLPCGPLPAFLCFSATLGRDLLQLCGSLLLVQSSPLCSFPQCAVQCWAAAGVALVQRDISLTPVGEPPWLLERHFVFGARIQLSKPVKYRSNHQDWVICYFFFILMATLWYVSPENRSSLTGTQHLTSSGKQCIPWRLSQSVTHFTVMGSFKHNCLLVL